MRRSRVDEEETKERKEKGARGESEQMMEGGGVGRNWEGVKGKGDFERERESENMCVCVCVRERERERESARARERERDRQTDRQTDTEREREREYDQSGERVWVQGTDLQECWCMLEKQRRNTLGEFTKHESSGEPAGFRARCRRQSLERPPHLKVYKVPRQLVAAPSKMPHYYRGPLHRDDVSAWEREPQVVCETGYERVALLAFDLGDWGGCLRRRCWEGGLQLGGDF